MKKWQSLQKMMGHLAFLIRLIAHLSIFNVGFTDLTVSILVWWFYNSLPLKFIETTRFEDDKVKNLRQQYHHIDIIWLQKTQDVKGDKINYLWQKACWECDIAQSPGTHERQQNEVFETKSLWEMWHEQILGTCTRQWKRLKWQATENYINNSQNADDVLESCQW